MICLWSSYVIIEYGGPCQMFEMVISTWNERCRHIARVHALEEPIQTQKHIMAARESTVIVLL